MSGLFFRGDGKLPFGSQIRPVRELIAFLLGETDAAARPVEVAEPALATA
jgi:hypothetical protein